MQSSHNGQTYLIDKNLQAAVNAALKLGMPLLVTGEPGTGKTKLASHIALQLGAQLLQFNTKTSSKAKDLLYKYNALTHFRDSQAGKENLNPMDYIRFTALGKAILDAGQTRSVVLIDEIDKAPRDFPNDVLFEFEELAFAVEEATPNEIETWVKAHTQRIGVDDQGFIRFEGKSSQRPVLILTSNSEKNLPDAFLRRCAYYHIPFPERDLLIQIVEANRPLSEKFGEKMRDDAITHFLEIRELGLRKKPATAELLAWIDLLVEQGIDVQTGLEGSEEEIREKLFQSYALLAKNQEDREKLFSEFDRS